MTTARNPIRFFGLGRVATGIAAVFIVVGTQSAPVPDVAARGDQSDPARPHLLTDEIGDLVIRIRGGAVCTGTPITGTNYVVTAAHCVLDRDGEVSDARTVLRDGVEYVAVAVLVDTEYHNSPGPRLDAAVLVMNRAIPGPSATLGAEFPTEGTFTLAGHQPLDTDGSLLRGTRYDNRPRPKGTTGGVVEIDTAVAGCVHTGSDLDIASDQVNVPCGLIPGASGGGLFVEEGGQPVLVGILSTVAFDLSYNGVAPLEALHRLLENPGVYNHEIPERGRELLRPCCISEYGSR